MRNKLLLLLPFLIITAKTLGAFESTQNEPLKLYDNIQYVGSAIPDQFIVDPSDLIKLEKITGLISKVKGLLDKNRDKFRIELPLSSMTCRRWRSKLDLEHDLSSMAFANRWEQICHEHSQLFTKSKDKAMTTCLQKLDELKSFAKNQCFK